MKKYWYLFYVLLILMIGLLIFVLLWKPNLCRFNKTIDNLNQQLIDCKNSQNIIDTTKKEKIDNYIQCNAVVKSGGQGETITQHDLGNKSGNVLINYDLYSIPDKIEVYYENNLVASTFGYINGSGTIQFFYTAEKGKPTYCTVK